MTASRAASYAQAACGGAWPSSMMGERSQRAPSSSSPPVHRAQQEIREVLPSPSCPAGTSCRPGGTRTARGCRRRGGCPRLSVAPPPVRAGTEGRAARRGARGDRPPQRAVTPRLVANGEGAPVHNELLLDEGVRIVLPAHVLNHPSQVLPTRTGILHRQPRFSIGALGFDGGCLGTPGPYTLDAVHESRSG